LKTKNSLLTKIALLTVSSLALFYSGCATVNSGSVSQGHPYLPNGQTRAHQGNTWYARIGNTDYAASSTMNNSTLAQMTADDMALRLRNLSEDELKDMDTNGDNSIDRNEFRKYSP